MRPSACHIKQITKKKLAKTCLQIDVGYFPPELIMTLIDNGMEIYIINTNECDNICIFANDNHVILRTIKPV